MARSELKTRPTAASVAAFLRSLPDRGREGDWMLTGFSPRKRDLTLYVMSGFDGHEELLRALGPHRTGKSCLSLRRAHASAARAKDGEGRTRRERR